MSEIKNSKGLYEGGKIINTLSRERLIEPSSGNRKYNFGKEVEVIYFGWKRYYRGGREKHRGENRKLKEATEMINYVKI